MNSWYDTCSLLIQGHRDRWIMKFNENFRRTKSQRASVINFKKHTYRQASHSNDKFLHGASCYIVTVSSVRRTLGSSESTEAQGLIIGNGFLKKERFTSNNIREWRKIFQKKKKQTRGLLKNSKDSSYSSHIIFKKKNWTDTQGWYCTCTRVRKCYIFRTGPWWNFWKLFQVSPWEKGETWLNSLYGIL